MTEEVKLVDDISDGLAAIGIQYQADGRPRKVAIYSKELFMDAYRQKSIAFVSAHSGGLTDDEVKALEADGEKQFWAGIFSAGVGEGAPIAVTEDENG
ncbi:MAG: hypothetical protein EBR82_12990 [Caulobacteraceae bacterium]|nr:hypothetical protein [Caulobacteraceae bacterium]